MAHLSAETRQVILKAASKLFGSSNFDKVRMEDVAEEARVGKVTVYRYFPTKDDLYFKLLEENGKEYLTKLRDASVSVKGCRLKLVVLVREAMAYFNSNKHLMKLLDRAGLDHDRQKKDFPWLDVQRQFFEMLQGLFAAGVARKEFGVDDLEIAVRALIGAMRFQMLYPCSEVSDEQLPERLVDMLIRPSESSSSKAA